MAIKLINVLSEFNSRNAEDWLKEQGHNFNKDRQILAHKLFVNQAECYFDKGVQIIAHVI